MNIHEVNGWWLPVSDSHFKSYAMAGKGYQSTLFNAAMTHIEDPQWALDIGAHVGFWSYMLSTRFPLVAAVEPVPENFACLKRNVPWVHGFNTAIAHTLILTMHNPAPKNSGAWERSEALPGSLEVTVPARGLDDWHEFCPPSYLTPAWARVSEPVPISLIKIDVQGMELEVLQTGTRLLEQKPLIVMEVVKDSKKDKAPIEYLKDRGASVRQEIGKDVIMGW